MADEDATLESLRQALREGKATSAVSQSMLSDPDGAKLIADYEVIVQKAIRQGQVDVAEKAATLLARMLGATAKLESATEVSDAAERNAVRVIIEELGKRPR